MCLQELLEVEAHRYHPETVNALLYIRANAKDRRIVFVSGAFNIVHPGHLRLLRFARECGDYLVVGVMGNELSHQPMPEDLRMEGIRAIKQVSYGFVLHDPVDKFIAQLKPAVVVKGKEHEDRFNPEAEVVAAYGGRLLFGSGDTTFSSLDLMRQEYLELNHSTIVKPPDYLERHGLDLERLGKTLRRMRALRVVVIGDAIIDEYITCDALGMSQEDPTIVVSPVQQQRYAGGAAIVAAHARGLGQAAHFFTVAGRDDTAAFLRQALGTYHVTHHVHADDSRPTSLKQRYRVNGKTMLRVSHLRQHAIAPEVRRRLLGEIRDVLPYADLVVFADFNYGCLPQPLVDALTAECLKHQVMMVADSQCSSQYGDVSRFHHMRLVSPTEREARLAVQDFDSGLVVLAEKLRQKAQAENVVVTLGAEGLLIHAAPPGAADWETDRLPAFNRTPRDVAGAGDSFLTCAAMALATGANIWEACYLGSIAAACQVGRVGNIPLSVDELRTEIAS
jgi:rfaE bifunctional protein kinase chain/domain